MNNAIIGGIVLIIVGVLLSALTKLDELGYVLTVIGVIAAIIGVVLLFTNRSGTRRL